MAMSKDLKSKDGFNPSLGIIDEYHSADDSRLLDVIESGQGSRPEPIQFVITTAGFKKQGPCYSMLRRVSIEVLNGVKDDDSQFSMIYEPDDDDDWEKESTWKKVNPNYGVSVYPYWMEGRYKRAKNEGASKETDFKTKNLNIWTDSAVVWIQDSTWMECDGERQDEGKRWYAGLDMGYKRDFTSLVLISEADKDGMHDVLSYHWIPEDTVEEKTLKDNSNIAQWVEDGLIFTTPGDITDHREIVNFILKIRETHQIINLVCDPAFAISTMNDLTEEGIETLGLPQNPSRLTPPTIMLYELIMKKKIRHGGDPVLRWMLRNCLLKTYTSSDLIKIIKEHESQRIDGIDALINALSTWSILEEDKGTFIAEIW
jgi:phage terminase large subunit-like protein